MTVNELRKLLKNLPGWYEVILSKDAEGNGHSPLDEIEIGAYDPETAYSGEFREYDKNTQPRRTPFVCGLLIKKK